MTTESINWTFLASIFDKETGCAENVSVAGASGEHAFGQALGLFVRLLRASGYTIDTEQMTYRDIPFEDWAADPEEALHKANEDSLGYATRPAAGQCVVRTMPMPVMPSAPMTDYRNFCRDED